jgi:hypothetical protein
MPKDPRELHIALLLAFSFQDIAVGLADVILVSVMAAL